MKDSNKIILLCLALVVVTTGAILLSKHMHTNEAARVPAASSSASAPAPKSSDAIKSDSSLQDYTAALIMAEIEYQADNNGQLPAELTSIRREVELSTDYTSGLQAGPSKA